MAEVCSRLLMMVLSCLTLEGYYTRAMETETGFRFTARVGSAVNFHLPDVWKCARFVFTDPHNNNIVTVYNRTYFETDIKYVNRSMISVLSNGTLTLTLHNIQHGDNGTFLIRPGGHSPALCWMQYLLLIYEDSWTRWSPWSDCSKQCGNGTHSRHRYCYRNQVQSVSQENCIGMSFENQNCFIEPCTTQGHLVPTPAARERPVNQWTTWSPWSSCSTTCGQGFVTRDRWCRDRVSIVDNQRCTGVSKENQTCTISECEHIETSPEYGNSGADEKVIQLPLYSIVGAGAGVFIVLLIIVICVLVIKLKKKGSFKKGKPTEASIRKKESVVSFSSLGVSGVHVYDEIDDVKSQRMSVLTIDNPYVTMPKSPRVSYSNTQESVFVFDNSTVGGHHESMKVPCTYQNIENKIDPADNNKLTVPRHMSVDSTGYLMPGTSMERAAARRQKKILK